MLETKKEKSLREILQKAGKDALGGGIPGLISMGTQVTSLMWLRTTMNYQYRYGGTMTDAMKKLYREGGVGRFYKGYVPALIQAPLSRFGDTAANAGVLSILDNLKETRDLPIMIKTLFASLSAGAFRILLMPIDTIKVIMQIEGDKGLAILRDKLKKSGPTVLYHGSIASSVATFAGHYPWFATYNYLSSIIPSYKERTNQLLRSAGIGFTASMISDSVSNSLRVIKITRQASPVYMTYRKAVATILEKDGILGLLGRGLKTKILSNGIQGLMFSVLWTISQDYYKNKYNEEDKDIKDKNV